MSHEDTTYWLTWRRDAGATVVQVSDTPVPGSGPVQAVLCRACQQALPAAAHAGAAAVQGLAQTCVQQHD